jgi:hypothetical protein
MSAKSLTEITRWLTLRCAHCGHRFRWSRDARHSFGNRDGIVYHGPCIAYLQARRRADERLEVLGWTLDIADLTGDEVRQVIELRMSMDLSTLDQGGKAWRVFYELGKARDAAAGAVGM